jgi:transcriptional regulator with XRE-family HTH domain
MADATIEIPTWGLHHRLARSLEFAGMKSAAMAEFLDVSENTIRNYLSGRTRPRLGVLRIWALRCGVPLDWLAGDDPDKTAVQEHTAENMCSTVSAGQAA